jgi:hypothetical protein
METPHYPLYMRLGGAVAGVEKRKSVWNFTEIGHWKA